MKGPAIVFISVLLFVLGLVVLTFLQKSQDDCGGGCSAAVAEGFADGVNSTVAPLQADLTSIMRLARRVGGTLLDPTLWQERYEMMGKDPVELARMYLKSQRKAE
jgi:hypothetical protein